jgi:hypothetical protein
LISTGTGVEFFFALPLGPARDESSIAVEMTAPARWRVRLMNEPADAAGVDCMAVGAIAAGACGVPRSTRDVDLLVSIENQ